MSIAVDCPQCGVTLRAPVKLAGKKARCQCGGVVHVPLADEPPIETESLIVAACPGCGAALTRGAVLCTGCGLDLRTGKRLGMSVDAPAATGEVKRSKPKQPSPKAEAAKATIIKFVVIAVVVGSLGGLGWYFYEMFSFDPVAQGKKRMAAVGSGMAVEKVVQVAGYPQATFIHLDSQQQEEYGVTTSAAKTAYTDDFVKRQGAKKLRNGFYFVYRFSAAGENVIEFDDTGHVIGKGEVPNIFNR